MPTPDDDPVRTEARDTGPGPLLSGPGCFRSVDEVAAYLGVSPKTVRRMAKAGELAAHRVRGQIRIHETAIAAYLEQARR